MNAILLLAATSTVAQTPEDFSSPLDFEFGKYSPHCLITSEPTTAESPISYGYGNDEHACWFLSCPSSQSSHYIEVRFTAFDVEDGFDFVTLLGWDDVGGRTSETRTYTGVSIPPAFTFGVPLSSAEAGVVMELTSDYAVTSTGITFEWECLQGDPPAPDVDYYPHADACPPPQTTASGETVTVSSYSSNQKNCYLLKCDNPNQGVELVFSSLDTEEFYDTVVVYEVLLNSLVEVNQHSGSNTPPATTYGNDIVVVFSADGSVQANGFSFTYNCGAEQVLPDRLMIENAESATGEYHKWSPGTEPLWIRATDQTTYFLTADPGYSGRWELREATSRQSLFSWNQPNTAFPTWLGQSQLTTENKVAPVITAIDSTGSSPSGYCYTDYDCLPKYYVNRATVGDIGVTCSGGVCQCGQMMRFTSLLDKCVCDYGFFFSTFSGRCMPLCVNSRPETGTSEGCDLFEVLECKSSVPIPATYNPLNVCDGCATSADCFNNNHQFNGLTNGAVCQAGVCTSCGTGGYFGYGTCACSSGLSSESSCTVNNDVVCQSITDCFVGFSSSTPKSTVQMTEDGRLGYCNTISCLCRPFTQVMVTSGNDIGKCRCRTGFAYSDYHAQCMRVFSEGATCSSQYVQSTCSPSTTIQCDVGFLPSEEGTCRGCSSVWECLPLSTLNADLTGVSCVINPGQIDGMCVCPSHMEWTNGACNCPEGETLNSNGLCTTIYECFNDLDCFADASLATSGRDIPLMDNYMRCVNNVCECGRVLELNAGGQCTCASWAVWDPTIMDCAEICFDTYTTDYSSCVVNEPEQCEPDIPWMYSRCTACLIDSDCSPDHLSVVEGITCLPTGRCQCSGAGQVFRLGACRCPEGITMGANGQCVQCTSNSQCMSKNGLPITGEHPGATCVGGVCRCEMGVEKVGDLCACIGGDYSFETASCEICSLANECFETAPELSPLTGKWNLQCCSGECTCEAPYVKNANMKCECPPGSFQDIYGICQPCSNDRDCFSQSDYAKLNRMQGDPNTICLSNRCECGDYLQDGDKCKLCTATIDCIPSSTKVSTIGSCTNDVCTCSAGFTLRNGVCGCATPGQIVTEAGSCADGVDTCTSNADCFVDGVEAPGVTCDLLTATCLCGGKTEMSPTLNKCVCKEGHTFTAGYGCAICNVNSDCLALTDNTSPRPSLSSDSGIVCINGECSCSCSYVLTRDRCGCAAGTSLDPLTGVCVFSGCTADADCLANAIVDPAWARKYRCISGGCVCGYAENTPDNQPNLDPSTYDPNWVLQDNGKCVFKELGEGGNTISTELGEEVSRFCSDDIDCVSTTDAMMGVPTGVACSRELGICLCTGDYEHYAGTICRRKGDTAAPTASLSISMLYSDTPCDAVDHDQLLTEFRNAWGGIYNVDPATIEVEVKCGSIGVQARLQVLANLLKVNSRNEFREIISTYDALNTLGEPATVAASSGTSLCAISYPVVAAEMFLGVCQPIKCVDGYELVKQRNLGGVDTCYYSDTTPIPTIPREVGEGADDHLFESIIVITGIVVILLIIFISCVLFFRYKSVKSSQYLPVAKHAAGEEENNNDNDAASPDKADV